MLYVVEQYVRHIYYFEMLQNILFNCYFMFLSCKYLQMSAYFYGIKLMKICEVTHGLQEVRCEAIIIIFLSICVLVCSHITCITFFT